MTQDPRTQALLDAARAVVSTHRELGLLEPRDIKALAAAVQAFADVPVFHSIEDAEAAYGTEWCDTPLPYDGRTPRQVMEAALAEPKPFLVKVEPV